MDKGKRCSPVTRGQATLFGFKKPSQVTQNGNGGGGGGGALPTQPSLPSVPGSVCQETIEPLVIAPVQPRQGTPKLGRAKKDGGRTANRFGFRPPTAMSNKVSDMQQSDSRSESDFRQSSRPQSVPALKLSSARSVSETRYNNKSATSRSNLQATSEQTSHGLQQRSTHLPQPQSAYHRSPNSTAVAANVTPNGSSTNSIGGPVADKWAKTKANNQKAAQCKQFQSSSASNTSANSPTDSGIGVQKSRRNESVLEIQQLDHSPNMGQKFRQLQHQQQQKSRPMEMIFSDSRTKRFELRDIAQVQSIRSMVMATGAVGNDVGQMSRSISPSQLHHNHHQQQHQHQAAAAYAVVNQQPPRAMSSSSGDEGFDEVSNGEEKQSRDKLSSEKVRLGCTPDDDEDTANIEGEDEETMWGRGEAMALDDQLPCANLADIDQSPESITPRLRSVLLTIEDPEFTSLAVMEQSTTMLEDEVVPESPDLSCSSPSSVEPLPPPPNLAGTPGSPGTPTHATNSLSSDAKDRDFLIDDEIADQPGLVFDTEDRHILRHDALSGRRSRDNLDLISGLADDISMLDTSRTIAKLAGEVSQALASVNGGQGGLQFSRGGHRQSDSVTSLNTLSPCESLASDDLIADFDRSDISAFDDLNELDDVPLKSEILNQSDQVMKEWTTLLSSHPGLRNGATSRTPSKPIRPRLRSTSSGSGSPSSIPAAAQSRIQANHNSTYGDEASVDSGTKLDRDKWEEMAHEVVYIKSMLLKLKRVLEEPGTDLTVPHKQTSLLTGLATSSEASYAAGEGATSPQLADLQRQIVLLNAQLEERDSRIERLEEALKRNREARPIPPTNSSIVKTNVATQTDRIRPLSSGPTLFQTSPDSSTTSFVSGIERSAAPISCQVTPMYSTHKRNAIRSVSNIKQKF